MRTSCCWGKRRLGRIFAAKIEGISDWQFGVPKRGTGVGWWIKKPSWGFDSYILRYAGVAISAVGKRAVRWITFGKGWAGGGGRVCVEEKRKAKKSLRKVRHGM